MLGAVALHMPVTAPPIQAASYSFAWLKRCVHGVPDSSLFFNNISNLCLVKLSRIKKLTARGWVKQTLVKSYPVLSI